LLFTFDFKHNQLMIWQGKADLPCEVKGERREQRNVQAGRTGTDCGKYKYDARKGTMRYLIIDPLYLAPP